MSRGGRGGFGARGGLKGATWEGYNPLDKVDGTPQGEYPPHPDLKRPHPFSEDEILQFKYYNELQTQVHRGPLFTQPTKRNDDTPVKTFSEDQFNRQYGTDRKADMDPFTGVETYSMRYLPKKNAIPKLSGRPFNKDLFPSELWSTLEGQDGEGVRKSINRAMQRRAFTAGMSGDQEAKFKALNDKIFEVAGDGDEIEDVEEEVAGDEEVDSAYEDEDMGDDYNAEQYFDDGEAGDDGDGDDGGGGGGDY